MISYRRRKIWNYIVCGTLLVASLIVLIPLISILGYVFSRGLPAINWSLFTQLPSSPGEAGGGLSNAIVGSILLITLAVLIGVPWGLCVAIYLAEYGNGKIGAAIRFSADVLSSIPSIVIGLFAYSLVVIPMGKFSVLAGGAALGVIMIPIVARSSEELLRLVPVHIREAGLALGAPRWKVIIKIVLRGSLSGITTGIILAVARVAGETAPLLFTALNNRFWTYSIDQPIASLPVQIYSYASSPYENWQNQAWAGAAVLVTLILILNLFMRFILKQRNSVWRFWR